MPMLAVLGLQSPAYAAGTELLYVAPAPTGSNSGNNCTSSGSPCATLAWAVQQAGSFPDDTVQINVAAGTYEDGAESVDVDTPSSETLDIVGTSGYNQTVLGDSDSGTDITIEYGAVVTISGLTITDGGDAELASSIDGGGVYNDGDTTLDNDSISYNSVGYDGGGIFEASDGTLTVTDSLVDGNSAGDGGGGIYNEDFESSRYLADPPMTLTGDTIESNSTSDGSGGGISNGYSETGYLSDNTIEYNSADYCGGGISNDGTLVDSGNTIDFDRAGECGGGGIYSDGTATLSDDSIDSDSAWYGGGIYADSGSLLTVTGGSISHNTAEYDGGGLYNSYPDDGDDIPGKGVERAAATKAQARVSVGTDGTTGTTGTGNTGGGGSTGSGTPSLTVTGVTLAGNESGTEDDGAGGGLWNDNTATLVDDTFSSDTASIGSGAVGIGPAKSANPSEASPGDTGIVRDEGGGAILNASDATLTLTDDTLANGTSAGNGGAIDNYGAATLVDDTVAGNISEQSSGGGALYNEEAEEDQLAYASASSSGVITIANSLIADNSYEVNGTSTQDNCGGVAVDDDGYNVADDYTCDLGSSSLVSSDSQIWAPSSNPPALAPNGSDGASTMAIMTASSAYAEVPETACSVSTDERGEPRPGSGKQACDAGAFEVQSFECSTPTIFLGQGEPTQLENEVYGEGGATFLPLSAGPFGIAVDTDTDTVYVTESGENENSGSGTVTVIDGSTDAVTGTITVGDDPQGIALDQTTDTIYVANAASNTVSVIDGADGTVLATIPVGSSPQGVAVDETTDTVYVANSGSDNVTVIDGASDSATATVTVGTEPQGVAVDATTDTIYVADAGSNAVSAIAGATNTVSATVAVGTSGAQNHPDGVAVDASTDLVYVSDSGTNQVSVIDAGESNSVSEIGVGANPSGIAIDPSNDTIWVAATNDADVDVINGANNTVQLDTKYTPPVAVGYEPQGIAIDPGNTVWVANQGSATATAITEDGYGTSDVSVAPAGASYPQGWVYNAIGYDTARDTIYGISAGGLTPGGDALPAGELLEIDPSNGLVRDLGALSDPTDPLFATAEYNSGAFDDNGNYYFMHPFPKDNDLGVPPPNDGTNSLYEISASNLENGDPVATTITLNDSISEDMADFTFSDGYFWAAVNNGESGYDEIDRIDPTTGDVTPIDQGVIPATVGTYGAAWTYGNGNLGFSNNTSGEVYEVAITNPTSSDQVADPTSYSLVSQAAGPGSQNNDGAACAAQPADLSIVKTGPSVVLTSGAVSYTLTVTNNGPGISSGFEVDDPVPTSISEVATATPGCTADPTGGKTPAEENDVSCVEGSLGVGDTFQIVIAGTAPPSGQTVTNTASVTGNEADPDPANNTSSVQTVVAAPSLSVVKTSPTKGYSVAGDTVDYDFLVTNTGNVTVSDIAVADSETAPADQDNLSAVTCPETSLAAGQAENCTASYTVTQADVDNGSLSDSATASGDLLLPNGTVAAVTSLPSSYTVDASQSASLTILKSSSTKSYSAVGDTIDYEFLVTNTGDVTVSDVTVHDTPTAPAGELAIGPTCPSVSLAPGASLTCTATYTVTQADLDNGSVSDSATASGKTPAGGTSTSNTSSATVEAAQVPSLELVKSSTTASYTAVGNTITYGFVATNTGNVTLSSIAVHDVETAPASQKNLSAISCPADPPPLAPGASETCTATYTVAQADLDWGSVNDTATASGSANGTTVTSGSSSVTVEAAQAPSLSIVKSSPTEGYSAAGSAITYDFLVTNTGNVTLSGVTVTDVESAPASQGNLSAIECPDTTLTAAGTAGDSETCTATYTVTQADVDWGSVHDTATASGVATGAGGTAVVQSHASSVTVDGTQTASLAVSKSSSTASFAAAGATVDYDFLVTNAGNVTLSGISVTDTETAPASQSNLSPVDCPQTSLPPGGHETCTATYTVTQADLDNGSVHDSATATGTPPGPAGTTGTPVVSGPSTATVEATQQAALSVVKSSPTKSYSAVGDVIDYDFLVTNTGNVTMSSISVTDKQSAPAGSLTSGPTCPAATLAPGASEVCTATYTVTQTDLNNGSVSDSATASGTAPSGSTSTSGSSSATVEAAQAPSLSVVKSSTTKGYSAVGNTITYDFLVTNTGNVTLSSISVTDKESAPATQANLSGPTCESSTLLPGASETCSATYTVTQADLDWGSVNDTATASGGANGTTVTSGSSSATVQAAQAASLSVVKSSTTKNYSAVGNTISYAFLVTNTGNVTLSSISVQDSEAAPASASGLSAPSCPDSTLVPQATETCTATYTVTQADLDNGSVSDTATASGTPPGQGASPVSSSPSSATVAATQSASIKVAKSSTTASYSSVGSTVDYDFVVTNTGNVTLSGISVDDTESAPAFQGNLSAVTCPQGSLPPQAHETCTATYTVGQADIDNGSVHDSATASGYPPGSSSAVTAVASTATVVAAQAPSLSVVKSSPTKSYSAVGNTIDYDFLVTNTGNVTLSSISVTDKQSAPAGGLASGPTCPAATLAPGASEVCTATYTVTQTDLNNGSVSDSATASGTAPSGSTSTSGSSAATVAAAQQPSLSVVKSSPTDTYSAVGNKINYDFLVTNTGNVTLSSISVSDVESAPATQGNLTAPSCPDGSLAPGASETCTASYTVTQADLDWGTVNDTATASGSANGTTVTSGGSSATVEGNPQPAITVVKSSPTKSYSGVGNTIQYQFVVTNDGNVTLSSVTVNDTELAPATQAGLTDPSCPDSVLAPGASETCTASYSVAQADIDNGSVTDTATASGTPPGEGSLPVTSAPSSATVDAAVSPALKVVKTASTPSYSSVGQTIAYQFLVTNTGDVTLSGIAVADTETAPASEAGLVGPSCPNGTLAPGAHETCTATYTVTQADLDNGSVSDSATASGTPLGSSTPVISGASTATVEASRSASLSLLKSSPSRGYSGAGNIVDYTFVVTNTGNVTLSGIAVHDTESAPATQGNLSAIACPSGALSPGQAETCTASYTVTQADLDNGSVSDSAVASGLPPGSDTPVMSSSSSATVEAALSPSLSVVKSSTTRSFSAVGNVVDYSFFVTNTGDVTMTGITVTDTVSSPSTPANLSAVQCPETSLSPQASETCSASYTVTQADIDNGAVNDTATASGTPPAKGATPVDSVPSTATVEAAVTPSLSVVKSSTTKSFSAVGNTVGYDFVVTNTGNVTLTSISVHDTEAAPAVQSHLSAIACPESSLAPGAKETCTGTYTVTQADIDSGSVSDTATASGSLPGQGATTVTSGGSSATVPAVRAASLTLVKSTPTKSVSEVGTSITYDFLVTNTGNVTLSSIAVHDVESAPATQANLSTVRCPVVMLAPKTHETCIATYTVTQADLNNGSVHDSANASALPAGSRTPVVSGSSSATVPAILAGYRLEGGDGGIFDFDVPYYGSVGFPHPPGLGLHIFNFVGIAPTSKGYWLAQSNGGIFAFGNAHPYGSLPGMGVTVNDIVGIAGTPDGGGYWMVSANGAVYPFGDAVSHGSLPGDHVNVSDIVAIVSPDAGGYWLIGADGGIFAFGDAKFFGSCSEPGSPCPGVTDVVGATNIGDSGYWMVSSDGAVYAFGISHYHGSCGQPGSVCSGVGDIVGIASPNPEGYWLAGANGQVFAFGDAKFWGNEATANLVRPIIAII
jgi:uncharacterized repeat protein (TIGR01451 family)